MVAVCGPTGSGKSDLGLFLAERLDGEIVNCDSLQVYRHFDIGTAKMPAAERRGVPHHLMDVVEPDELFTAGEYARVGREALREIAGRGRTPIVVGGTGFYLRALIDGLSPTPQRDDALRARLQAREDRRPGSLHRILRRLDPDAGRRIHANDVHKTTRALELRLLRDPSPLPARVPLEGFFCVKIGLNPDRAALHARLNARLERMFSEGLLEEIRANLALGVSPLAKPFESLGYKEGLLVVQGKLSLPDALAAAQLATRQYAKRQLTWFRREAGMAWFEGFGDDPAVQLAVWERLK
jgi:tRNA dimethylallyltransferase